MRNLVLATILLLAFSSLNAQQSVNDSALELRQEVIRQLYDQQRNNELALYNGTQHYPYPLQVDGIAYFKTAEWKKGSVIFEDILYENIFMKYDLVKDQLIVAPFEDGGLFVSLYSPRVRGFAFDGNRFVRIDKTLRGSTYPEGVSAGFYQVLSQGKVTALAKTSKVIEEKVEMSGITRWFEQKVRYYILKDGEYHRINSKNDLLSALKEHKREVQQQLSRMKLKFRKQKAESIFAAAEIYNQSN